MQITIRPTVPEDLPVLTGIYNEQNEPHHQATEQELRRGYDRARQRGDLRLTALVDGRAAAMGQAGVRADDAEPGKYWAWFFVRSDLRNRGVDTALWDEVVSRLDRPRSIWTCVREDFVPAAGYLVERGYVEQFRSWGANLDLGRFDPGRFIRYEEELARHRIRLLDYRDLEDDPRRDEKLAALQAELEEDAPAFDPIVPRRHASVHDEDTNIDSLIVAVRGEEYVGMTSLLGGSPRFQEVAGSGITGVRRGYRNLGIATALKARTASWAKARGYSAINAGGAAANGAILAVNRRIGFDVEPYWMTLARQL